MIYTIRKEPSDDEKVRWLFLYVNPMAADAAPTTYESQLLPQPPSGAFKLKKKRTPPFVFSRR
jgi:hypothetical protein